MDEFTPAVTGYEWLADLRNDPDTLTAAHQAMQIMEGSLTPEVAAWPMGYSVNHQGGYLYFVAPTETAATALYEVIAECSFSTPEISHKTVKVYRPQ